MRAILSCFILFLLLPSGEVFGGLVFNGGLDAGEAILSGTSTSPAQMLVSDIIELDRFTESVGHILIELPGPIVASEAGLPPTDGVYRSPAEVWAKYMGPDLEIVLQEVRLRPLADPPPVVSTVGADEVENFQMMAMGTAIITMSGSPSEPIPVELTGQVETIVMEKADQTTGSFDAEIVWISLWGEVAVETFGLIPILMRESPTMASSGHVSINDVEGGFLIGSSFDVFTELSVDGGDSWMASNNCAHVELVQPRLIAAAGPSEVLVFFEGSKEGEADDDDMDGFDEVETEVSGMEFRGHSSMGPVSIGLRAGFTSSGEIAEQTNNLSGILEVAPFDDGGFSAESFFDVWPEIRMGEDVLATASSLHMESLIGHKPPLDGERYVNPYLNPVELVDPNTGAGSGIFIVRQVYQPGPTVEYDYFAESQMYIGLQLPTGEVCNVVLKGPSSVDVYFEGDSYGDAVDDDLNGRDEVTTQMKTLQLAGYHPAVGEVHLNLNSQELALGQIEETSNISGGVLDLSPFGGAGTAESFFDVFFEIEIPSSSLVLHNEEPLRIASTVTHKPPDSEDLFEGLQELSLVNEFGEASGFRVITLLFRTGRCSRCSDFDGSTITDFPDLGSFAENWLWEASYGDSNNAVDLDCDGRIDLSDFAIFSSGWLQACP